MILISRQASTTAFEKCEPKLSSVKATGPFKAQAFGKKNLKNHFSNVTESNHPLVVKS